MSIRVGVGTSAVRASRVAGGEAARQALLDLGGAPQLVLVFATVGHDPAELLAGIVAQTGDAPLVGCSGTGIISQAGSSESAFAVAIMALGGDGLEVRSVLGRDVSRAIDPAAEAIAQAIGAMPSAKMLLLFPDGLKANASALLAAIDARSPRPLPILGGSAGEVLAFERTYQFFGAEALEDAVVAVVLGGQLELEVEVTHGCSLLGLVHEVTDAEGGVVRTLDGRPAWDVMGEYVASPEAGLASADLPYLCLAQPVAEGEHLIRVPLGLDAASGSLFFPGALARGDRIVMARRDAERVAGNAVEAAERLRARRAGRAPAFVLQFDCAGRGALLFGHAVTEKLIEPVQQVFGKDVRWIGFHSYGELAPLRGKNHFHQYTMALCAVYDP